MKFMEIITPALIGLFLVSFLVKIINYAIFDRYHTELGKLGSLFIGLFMHYKKYEIEEETDKTKRTSKIINNVCGYVMLAILAIVIIFIIYILKKI